MENNENSQTNKPHLLYMTGLSIDKNRMNNITENINFDKDFSHWIEDTVNEFTKAFSLQNESTGLMKNFFEKKTKNAIEDLVTLKEFIDLFANEYLEEISDNFIDKKIGKPIREKFINLLKSGFSKIFDLIGYLDKNEKYGSVKILFEELVKEYQKTLPALTNGDFFSLYLSNQSDSIGLVPLAKLSHENEMNFNIAHSYCDKDFYDNKYIDHVILRVDTTKLPSIVNCEEVINAILKLHTRELVFSKLINKKVKSLNINKENENVSIVDLMLNDNPRYKKNDIIQMLGERNFFGVSLLSQILFFLSLNMKETNNGDDLGIENHELKFYIDEKQDEYHFLKELIEMSSEPDKLTLEENINDSFISAKIYFSDGIKLTKENLYKDDYFLNTCNFTDNFTDKEKIEDEIKDYHQNTVGKLKKDSISYVQEKDDYLYIKVPIKIVLSLPLDENEEPNSNIYIFLLVSMIKMSKRLIY